MVEVLHPNAVIRPSSPMDLIHGYRWTVVANATRGAITLGRFHELRSAEEYATAVSTP